MNIFLAIVVFCGIVTVTIHTEVCKEYLFKKNVKLINTTITSLQSVTSTKPCFPITQ